MDAQVLMRRLGNQKKRTIHQKENRAHVLAHEVEFVEGNDVMLKLNPLIEKLIILNFYLAWLWYFESFWIYTVPNIICKWFGSYTWFW